VSTNGIDTIIRPVGNAVINNHCCILINTTSITNLLKAITSGGKTVVRCTSNTPYTILGKNNKAITKVHHLDNTIGIINTNEAAIGVNNIWEVLRSRITLLVTFADV